MASENSSELQQPGRAEDYTVDKIIELVEFLCQQIDDADLTFRPQDEYQNADENANSSEDRSAGESISGDAATLRASKSIDNKINNQGAGGTSTGSQHIGVTRTQSAPLSQNGRDGSENSTHKIRRNLLQLKHDVSKLKHLQNDVGKELEHHLKHLKELVQEVKNSNDSGQTSRIKKEFGETSRKIFNLMCRVPVLPDKRRKLGGSDSQSWDNEGKANIYLPGIHANEPDLISSVAFEEVMEKFLGLKIDRKLCLLTFAVFPANGEVKKRMLMYWWIGEGFLPIEKAEEDVDVILNEFMEKGLIEPLKERHKLAPTSYKMAPLVHSAVVLLSKELGFSKIYGETGKPTMEKSAKKRVCLVEGSSGQPEAKVKKMGPGDLETVFNISERFPDFTFKWFPEMKSLKVLYLGRWERTAQRHIEVDSPELMKDLSAMSKLRFLSFQGISRVERLSSSICKLPKLTILDLRACYNLEELPEKIDSLENLVYLDITDCYMIHIMPKRLSSLSKLVVLKGFVVSDADKETTCTLTELKHLRKLRKLSITINREDFKLDNLIDAVLEFKELQSLKVAWGAINKFPDKQPENDKGKKAGATTASAKAHTGGEKEAKASAEKKATTLEKKDKNKEKSGLSAGGAKDAAEEKKDEKMQKAGASNPSEIGSVNKNQAGNPLKPGEGQNSVQVAEKSISVIREISETPQSGKNKDLQADALGNAEKQQKRDVPEIEEETKEKPKPVENKDTNAHAETNIVTGKPMLKDLQNRRDRRVNFAVVNGERHATKCWPLIHKTGDDRKGLKRAFTRLLSGRRRDVGEKQLPEKLEKLDLQCVPDAELPDWLQPASLHHLKRLYIKGGRELTGFGDLPTEPTECAVEVLRLKFLPKLMAEWRDLKELYFPKLYFLEKYQCPRVTFCPCDGMGIWTSGARGGHETPNGNLEL